MKKFLRKFFRTIAIVSFYLFTWATTCGVIYLITKWLDWNFSWFISSYIWLGLCVAEMYLSAEKM